MPGRHAQHLPSTPNYLTWRRRKGPQMFAKYGDDDGKRPLVAEWANTIRIEEVPTASAPKP
jgi:hypothetical protein